MPCRRQFDLTLGLDTLTPITTIHERVKVWGEQSGKHIDLQVRASSSCDISSIHHGLGEL